MEEIKLDVQIRKELGKQNLQKVRKEDYIPSVVYGGKEESLTIKVDRRTFNRLERAHRGESVVLHLSILDGEKKLKDFPSIIKEIQHHPVSDRILHIDFTRISLTEEIEVKIPIVAQGEAVGVKKDGGTVDHHLRELDVVCLPMKIPQNIEIDISSLEIHDAVHVKDLVLPEGVITNHDQEEVVLSVAPPMKEIEEEPAEEEASVEPEVVKEKKEDQEEASGESASEKEKTEG